MFDYIPGLQAYYHSTYPALPNATAQRVPSAQSPNGEYPSESAVWNYDETTGILTPQWVNADGCEYLYQEQISNIR